MASASGVKWVLLDPAADNPVRVGEVVSTEAGGMPIYRVVALADGKVWLGDDSHAAVRVMPLAGFRWKGAIPQHGLPA